MPIKLAESESTTAGRAARPLSPAVLSDLLRLLDVASILIVGFVIYRLYVYGAEPQTQSQYLVTLLVAAILAGLLLQWFGVYAGDFLLAGGLRMDRLLAAWAVTFGLLLATAFALKISDHFSRVWATSWFFASGSVLGIGRVLLAQRIAGWARDGRFAKRTVIVGTGEQAAKLAAHLESRDRVRSRVIGFATDRRPDTLPACAPGVLGDLDHLVRLIRAEAVDQVYLALPWHEPERLRAAVQRLAVTPVAVRLAPDLAGFDFLGRPLTEVAGLPVIGLFERPLSGWSQLSKAIEDRVLASLFLTLLAPLLLAVAALIKLDSPGPVFFRQRRYGFNDNLIEVLKFRTMYAEAMDERAERLTTHDDERVTRVGRILRRLSLDELPQLFNVLRGEMSLVGPRPHALAAKAGGRPYDEAVDRYAARHRVKPGITGWAQVSGWRGETDTLEKIEKRVEYDLYYIDNWSLWLDLYILAKTVRIVFRDEKAY